MIFAEILNRIVKKSPVTALARGAMEYALREEDLDKVFDNTAERQYTRSLLFSTMVSLMALVVSKSRRSVRAAYLAIIGETGVKLQSVYNKLDALETSVSQGLVRHVSGRLADVVQQMPGGAKAEWLPGYRVKLLDGNHLAATEHRITELRKLAAGPLPGFVLAIYDPCLDLVIDVLCEEDGHAQERSLTGQLLMTVEQNDLWIDDRNFCTTTLLFGIDNKKAFFATRQHKSNVRWSATESEQEVGATDTGVVFEHQVVLSGANGSTMVARRIVVKLKGATRDGDKEISILTNLPAEVAGPTIAGLYRGRWSIERLFQELERGLNGEITTLGYPKAALFSFCIALCTYNMYATVKASIRAGLGADNVGDEISDFRIASEVAAVFGGIDTVTEPEDWTFLQRMTASEFADWMVDVARHVNFITVKKARRGPKKPQPKRVFDPKSPHVSTARLLAGRRTRKASRK